ncbi:unnamed protein product [Lampetra planeri]
MWNFLRTRGMEARLRRSLSEHVRSSTCRARHLLWRNLREKRLAEIELRAACDWLCAAGFPQYAQLYRDLRCPIDISAVHKDHAYLDQDSFESLCSRLMILNKCALMKVDVGSSKNKGDDSDDDDKCAISEKWVFDATSRKWVPVEDFQEMRGPWLVRGTKSSNGSSETVSSSMSTQQSAATSVLDELESVEDVEGTRTPRPETTTQPLVAVEHDEDGARSSCRSSPSTLPADRCAGDRQRASGRACLTDEDGCPSVAKGFLKRVENLSLKRHSKRKAAATKERLQISGPLLQAGANGEHIKLTSCSCKGNGSLKITSNGPLVNGTSSGDKDDLVLSPSKIITSTPNCCDATDHSCGPDKTHVNSPKSKADNCFLIRNQIFQLPQDYKPGTFPRVLLCKGFRPNSCMDDDVNWRTGSFHLRGKSRVSSEDRGGGHGDARGYKGLMTSASADSLVVNRRLQDCDPLERRISLYDNVPFAQLPPVRRRSAEPSVPGQSGEKAPARAGGPDLPCDVDFTNLDDVIEHVIGVQRTVSLWSQQMWRDLQGPPEDSSGKEPSSLSVESTSSESASSAAGSEGRPFAVVDGSGEATARTEANGSPTAEQESPTEPSSPGDLDGALPLLHKALHVTSVPLQSLSVLQLRALQTLSLLKLTALLEKYSPSNKLGWNWAVPSFMKRIKMPDSREVNVFGAPLLANAQRTGRSLPPGIQEAVTFLAQHGCDQVGLFRKSGVKSRIQALRDANEACRQGVTYEGHSPYDVADLLKQYFRDLPEPLLTSRLSDSVLLLYQFVPKEQRLQGLQAAVLLAPQENRQALQALLHFLGRVVERSHENQMTAANLSVCLAPSIFHLTTLKRGGSSSRSLQRKPSLGKPDLKELSENLAASQALAHMISKYNNLFQVPVEMLWRCGAMNADEGWAAPGTSELRLAEGGRPGLSDLLDGRVLELLREARDKFRGWTAVPDCDLAELAYKKIEDGSPLRPWKACVEVGAPACEVLHRVLRERNLWDPDLLGESILESLDDQTEIYQIVQDSTPLFSKRDYVLLRTWRTDLPKGCCALTAVSVQHALDSAADTVRALVLDSRYLVEPCGAGRSKLTHVCRTDVRGRSPDWYRRVFGLRCAAKVARIRSSFQPPSPTKL